MPTNIPEFFTDLDGGVFEAKLSRALSDVAAGVIDHEKSGKIVITLKIKRVGNSQQVMINHNLNYVRPTNCGDISENNETQTPMYVGEKGEMTYFLKNQGQMFEKMRKTE